MLNRIFRGEKMNGNPIKWLKEMRKEKHLSTYEAARISGVSQSHYAMIENGCRGASPKTAKKIAAALGFDWTLFFEDEKNNPA